MPHILNGDKKEGCINNAIIFTKLSNMLSYYSVLTIHIYNNDNIMLLFGQGDMGSHGFGTPGLPGVPGVEGPPGPPGRTLTAKGVDVTGPPGPGVSSHKTITTYKSAHCIFVLY